MPDPVIDIAPSPDVPRDAPPAEAPPRVGPDEQKLLDIFSRLDKLSKDPDAELEAIVTNSDIGVDTKNSPVEDPNVNLDTQAAEVIAEAEAILSQHEKPVDVEAQAAAEKELDQLELTYVSDPEQIVNLLLKAQDASARNLDSQLAKLRQKRAGGSSFRHDDTLINLDEVLILLAKGNHFDLVGSLLSSSPKEVDTDGLLFFHLNRMITDPVQAAAVKDRIVQLHDEKHTKFIKTLTARGADPYDQQQILNRATDPDSALTVSRDFWQMYSSLQYDAKAVVLDSHDIGRIAELISMMHDEGLTEYAQILPALSRIDSPQQQMRYLSSLRKVVEVVRAEGTDAQNRLRNTNQIIREIAKFEDPAVALDGVKSLFGDDYANNIVYFQNLCQTSRDRLTTFTPDYLKGLIRIKALIDDGGMHLNDFEYVAEAMQQQEDPLAFSHNFVDAVILIKDLPCKEFLSLSKLALVENPVAFAEALIEFKPVVEGLEEAQVQELYRKLIFDSDPTALTLLYTRAEVALQGQGLGLEQMGLTDFSEFSFLLRDMSLGDKHFTNDDERIERYSRKWKMEKQYSDAYAKCIDPTGKIGRPENKGLEGRPQLKDMPELRDFFAELGIKPELAEEIFNSWDSYRALLDISHKEGDPHNATKDQIDRAIVQQTSRLLRQVEYMSEYNRRYGNEELHSIIQTFGIYNFVRYRREDLHDQHIRWQKGDVPVKNIVVTARADWNGSMDKTLDKKLDDGLYRFEANNRGELGRVAIAVGDHERAHGRNPLETNSLENFIIGAHASPGGMLLGVNGERLSVDNYLRAEKWRQSRHTKSDIYDYRQHLGKRFRLILQACSTAGEAIGGRNIARSISEGLGGRLVEASRKNTVGSFIINSDDSVSFPTDDGEIPSTTYGSRN